MAIYYYATDDAEAILREGFHDPDGAHWIDSSWDRGVFLSDWPAGANDDQVLEVQVPSSTNLSEFAIVEEGSVSEWCVPAAVINEHATVRLLTRHEIDEFVRTWSFVRRSRGS